MGPAALLEWNGDGRFEQVEKKKTICMPVGQPTARIHGPAKVWICAGIPMAPPVASRGLGGGIKSCANQHMPQPWRAPATWHNIQRTNLPKHRISNQNHRTFCVATDQDRYPAIPPNRAVRSFTIAEYKNEDGRSHATRTPPTPAIRRSPLQRMARSYYVASVGISLIALVLIVQVIAGFGSPSWSLFQHSPADAASDYVSTLEAAVPLEKENLEARAGNTYLIGAGKADITGYVWPSQSRCWFTTDLFIDP
jgi:hypothetical protein